MEPDFMGKEGFVWAVGVVEDRFDPLYLGRCRVRWLGWHTKDKQDLPTDLLPWAFPLMPLTSAAQTGVGTSPTGPVEGTWIMGFFRDGENANDPVMIGTLGGRPDKPCNPDEGFNDPRDYSPAFYQVDAETGKIVKDIPKFADVPQHPLSVKMNKQRGIEIVERSDKAALVQGQTDEDGKLTEGVLVDETESQEAQVPDYEFSYNYPLFRFLGEPTTPRLARGREDGSTKIDTVLTSNHHGDSIITQQGTSIVQTKADLRMNPFPMAKGTGKATFQEPVSPYDAAYPYNHVHVSESGHVIEMDDTPTRERLHWWHRSGTYREIGPLGTMVDKSNRDYYSCVLKNTHESVGGNKYSSIKYGYELCVNTAGGQEDYWLRVKGSGDVHLEAEQGNVEIYCKDGIAFINASKIEFNAKESFTLNTPLFLESSSPIPDLPSLHGGPMIPREENTGKIRRMKGNDLEQIDGGKTLIATQITQSTMGSFGISAQSEVKNLTHSSEEIIQGMNVLNKGSGAGKTLTVNNGIINLRAASALTGGLLFQLNQIPSPSEKGAKSSSIGYIGITPKNVTTARITMATPMGAITMKNKVGEISLGDSPSGEIKIQSSGAMGEINISNKAKGVIAIDGAGLISIKNDVASLKKILDDFFTEYQSHQHDLVGGVSPSGGPLLPGAKALPMVPGTFPKTMDSQLALNSLLS
tara:strand:+ start:310 stop:2394 length:2085 start_codon:yes stop_codon:yes gene_type:complete